MKVSSEWTIGEALFRDNPVDVEVEFPNCTAVFQMTALTADVIADLEGEGVSFEKIKSGKQALIASRKLLSKIVHGWTDLVDSAGTPVPYNEHNRDQLAAAPNLVAQFWQIGSDLAATKAEEETKN